MGDKTFKEGEEEQAKLNNEIVVPHYRQFCKENGLTFHFWDELPKEQFDAEIAHEEFKLHREAMNCFNNLKPKFIFFNNKIYTFHFTDWGGEFDSQSWEIENFLNKTHEQINRVAGLEKQLRFAFEVIVILTFFSAIGFCFILCRILLSENFSFAILVINFTISFVFIYLLRKRYFNNPTKKYLDEIAVYQNRLETLKEKFKKPIEKATPDNNLFEKANELVDCARVLTAVIRPQLLTKYPELYLSKELDTFDIAGTIAFACLVCINLHYEVKIELRTPLEVVAKANLKEFYPDALKDYTNLNNYIKDNILKESDRKKRLFHIHKLSALWILIKIRYIEDFRNPSSKALEIAEDLATQFYNESRGYWNRL